MTKLTEKQMKAVESARTHGQALIRACDDLQSGKIDAEEFEKRISKASPAFYHPSSGSVR